MKREREQNRTTETYSRSVLEYKPIPENVQRDFLKEKNPEVRPLATEQERERERRFIAEKNPQR